MQRLLLISIAGWLPSILIGCGVPRYDVPVTKFDQPTVASIVERIQCEVRDMVRDDRPEDPTTFHRLFLLNGDYEAEILLSVEVNDSGGLAPSLSYTDPLKIAGTTFGLSVNATLSEARDHTFTESIQLSTRDIFVDWKTGRNAHECPVADTNLAGTLGLKDFVSMAALTDKLDEKVTLASKGVFGGSVQFIVTKNLSAIGPTWTLQHFKGPGALASLSEINTDKITIAFAQGPNIGKRMDLATREPVNRSSNPTAHYYIQQLLTNSIDNRLSILNVR